MMNHRDHRQRHPPSHLFFSSLYVGFLVFVLSRGLCYAGELQEAGVETQAGMDLSRDFYSEQCREIFTTNEFLRWD